MLPTATASAAWGDLDPAFSGDGRVAITGPGPFVARAVALDAEGRILVAGSSCTPDPDVRDGTCRSSGDASFRVARLTRDGGLDPEFGQGGFIQTPVGEGRSQANDIIPMSDGTFVLAGVARSNKQDVFAFARIAADGSLVEGFGTGGKALIGVGGWAAASAVAEGPGGTVIASGQATDAAGRYRTAVVRLTPDGVLDPAYGTGGVTLGGAPYGTGLGVSVTADGTVTTAGIAAPSSERTTYGVGVLRLLPDGRPDGFFGPEGASAFPLGTSSSFANAVVGAADGAWVAAGTATVDDGRQAMALVRGRSNGGADPGFGAGTGSVLVPLGDSAVANDLAASPDGRLLAAGHVQSGGAFAFSALQLLADGSRDPNFGTDGVSSVGWERYPVARATAAVLQPDGNLVLVGIGCADGGSDTTCKDGTSVLLAARVLDAPPAQPPPPPPDPGPPVGTDTTGPVVAIKGAPKRISRKALRRRGIRIKLSFDEPARAIVRLFGRKKGGRTRLARVDRKRARRTFKVKVRPRAGMLAKARKGKLRLEVRATDAAGNRTVKTVNLKLR